MNQDHVWVFTGGGQFPAGVFTTRVAAEEWISANQVTGCLTRYPLNESLYDWSVREGFFKPKREDQITPGLKATFSSAYAEHYHYENGVYAG